MNEIEVRTQAELDAALERQDVQEREALIVVCGDGRFVLRENASPTMEARENASPTMEAWGNASPRMVAWGNASPRMVAWGNASPRMVARENASPRMVARGNASPTMEAWENASPTMVARENASPRMVARENASPTMVAWGNASPRMVARGNASPTMEAWGNASPRMVARENASPTMVAWGNASPRMVARENASPTMVAWGNASPRMVARENASVTVTAGRYSQPSFWRHGSAQFDIPGAVILEPSEIETAQDWLDYYGIEVEDGVAILFKAVRDDYVSSRGFVYAPGSEPECDDWNADPKIECGEGLHFCPTPSVARKYKGDATKFVACPIAVSAIVVSQGGGIPDKVRAPKVAGPIWECDIDGEPVDAALTNGKAGGREGA